MLGLAAHCIRISELRCHLAARSGAGARWTSIRSVTKYRVVGERFDDPTCTNQRTVSDVVVDLTLGNLHDRCAAASATSANAICAVLTDLTVPHARDAISRSSIRENSVSSVIGHHGAVDGALGARLRVNTISITIERAILNRELDRAS